MLNLKRGLLTGLLAVAAMAAAYGEGRGLAVTAAAGIGSDIAIGKQIAVLIAVDRYQEWPALRNPVRDAKAIKTALEQRYCIDEFIELYDEEATAVGIRRLFTDLIARTGPTDSVLLYYAGHGFTDASRTGFWIPVDGAKNVETQDRWVPNQQIRNLINQMKARSVVLVADACFSGDLLNLYRGSLPAVDAEYLRNALRYVSRQVLTSGASEAVPDDSEFSRQFKLLLETNTETMIDPVLMYDRIRRGVTRSLPLLGTLPGQESGGSFLLFLKPNQTPAAVAAVNSVPGSASISIPAVAIIPAAASLQTTAIPEGDSELLVAVTAPFTVGDVQVYIDGRAVGAAPALVTKLPSGVRLTVEARSEGGYAKTVTELTPKTLTELTVNLERVTGNLLIDCDRKTALVRMDGAVLGPIGAGLFRDIAAGGHRLEVADGDFVFIAPVTVPAGETGRISAKADQIGRVAFHLTPADAELVIDGAAFGPAPRAIALVPGNYRVALRSPGYREVVRDLVVKVGTTTELAETMRELLPGTLEIDEPPFGALIVAGEQRLEVGDSAVNVKLPAGVPIALKIQVPFAESLEGFTVTSNIVLEENESRKIDLAVGRFSLPLLPVGSDAIIVSPDGERISIPLTNTGGELCSPPLAVGAYTVVLNGPIAYSGQVIIKNGKTTELPDYRTIVRKALQSQLTQTQRDAKRAVSRFSAGWVAAGASLVGSALAFYSYAHGSQAYSDYTAAKTTTAAITARDSVNIWGGTFIGSALAGGIGLVLAPLLWVSAGDRAALSESINALDQNIKALGGQ